MDLTFDKIKEVIKLFRDSPGFRKPIFHYSPYVDDIYCGEVIDKILKIEWPAFNSKYDQGFLVPLKYQALIQEYFNMTDYRMGVSARGLMGRFNAIRFNS